VVAIIVAGHLFVDAADRDEYLHGCVEVMELARRSDGCLDFSLTPDPIDPGRINIFEHWDSVDAVEAFRGSGPSDEQATAIRDAVVYQHVIDSSTRL
jgi:quinol monooxygenase YgiN